jgi:LPS export ABC transporter permease LptG/LPS export ABC transporter permease LptF
VSAEGLQYTGPLHRRPGRTIYLYVAREAFRPALIGLIGLTTVVLTTGLLGLSDLVINRGVEAGDVARMLLYQAIPTAARMFPFATLVGALVALGRLGADREILTLEALGVPAARLVWPVAAFSAAMTVLALWFSVYATPWASARFDAALDEISRTKPWATMRAGAVNEFGGWQLEAREVSAAGDVLKGVLLWLPDLGETIFARGGTLAASADGSIEITLHDGTALLHSGLEPRMIQFESVTTVLPESDSGLERSADDRVPMLPLEELIQRADSWVPTERDRLPRPALELHRRFAYPLASLVFGFLAVPLFLARKNFSRAGGGVIALLCTLAYYGLMQLGEGLVQAGTLGPALGAWLPNILLGVLAGALLVRALRERVGGHAFDRPLQRSWRILGWLRSAPAEGVFRGPRRLALPRYVSMRFLELVALSFAVLFVAYLLIDVLDRLEWFTRHEATALGVVRFYGARGWLLASRAFPMAILVATSLIVSLLAVEGELIGMRSCGISATRGTLPVLLIAILFAPLYFLLNNVVVPRTNALADVLKNTEIKARAVAEDREASKAGYWYRSGSQLLEAALFDPDRGQAQDLTIFDLGEDGLPLSRTDARAGRHIGQGWWRLTDPSRVELNNGRVSRVPAPRHAQLGDTVEASIDTMHLSVNAIAAEARAVEEEGFDATPFWLDYHARLAEPFACLVLPALVLFFAVGGPPFPGPAQTLLMSGIVGVSYILLVAVAKSLGRGGALAPVLGAWGPISIFGVIAIFLFTRVWRRL